VPPREEAAAASAAEAPSPTRFPQALPYRRHRPSRSAATVIVPSHIDHCLPAAAKRSGLSPTQRISAERIREESVLARQVLQRCGRQAGQARHPAARQAAKRRRRTRADMREEGSDMPQSAAARREGMKPPRARYIARRPPVEQHRSVTRRHAIFPQRHAHALPRRSRVARPPQNATASVFTQAFWY